MTRLYEAAQDMKLKDGAMRFASDRIQVPDAALFNPHNPELHARPVQVGGRQSAWFVRAAFGSAVLRHYRRGGFIARLSRDRYLWRGAESTRSFAEFNLLDFMYRQGLPVPRPLAAAYWRQGLTYRAAIMVDEIAGVHTLAKSLGRPDYLSVAQAIFAMHEAGVWHADLNAYNILLNEQGRVWLIDFDKGRRMVLSKTQREANLLRLRRSLVKVAASAGLNYWTDVNQAYMQLMNDKSHL